MVHSTLTFGVTTAKIVYVLLYNIPFSHIICQIYSQIVDILAVFQLQIASSSANYMGIVHMICHGLHRTNIREHWIRTIISNKHLKLVHSVQSNTSITTFAIFIHHITILAISFLTVFSRSVYINLTAGYSCVYGRILHWNEWEMFGATKFIVSMDPAQLYSYIVKSNFSNWYSCLHQTFALKTDKENVSSDVDIMWLDGKRTHTPMANRIYVAWIHWNLDNHQSLFGFWLFLKIFFYIVLHWKCLLNRILR